MKRILAQTERKQSGFTLVETLVAITVLALSIAGPMTIASKGLQSAVFAKEQTTAAFLAQDAIEFIRSARDGNILAGDAWLSGMGECTYDAGNTPQWCTVDTVGARLPNQTFQSCSGGTAGSCSALSYDETSGFYEHDSGDPTSPYTRAASIERLNSDEALVRVTVQWEQGSIPRQFTVQENIYNWIDN